MKILSHHPSSTSRLRGRKKRRKEEKKEREEGGKEEEEKKKEGYSKGLNMAQGLNESICVSPAPFGHGELEPRSIGGDPFSEAGEHLQFGCAEP